MSDFPTAHEDGLGVICGFGGEGGGPRVFEGAYVDLGEEVMTNFDNSIDDQVAARLVADPSLYAQHSAWDFCGYVRHEGAHWVEEVWRHHAPVETLKAPSLPELKLAVNDRFGWE